MKLVAAVFVSTMFGFSSPVYALDISNTEEDYDFYLPSGWQIEERPFSEAELIKMSSDEGVKVVFGLHPNSREINQSLEDWVNRNMEEAWLHHSVVTEAYATNELNYALEVSTNYHQPYMILHISDANGTVWFITAYTDQLAFQHSLKEFVKNVNFRELNEHIMFPRHEEYINQWKLRLFSQENKYKNEIQHTFNRSSQETNDSLDSSWWSPVRAKYNVKCGSDAHTDSDASVYAADVSTPTGTRIYAAKGGTVTHVGYHSLYGNYVKIKSGSKVAYYAHLENISFQVKYQEGIDQGKYIGKSGNTGSSRHPHLHFHVRDGSTSIKLNGMDGFTATTYPTSEIEVCGTMEAP